MQSSSGSVSGCVSNTEKNRSSRPDVVLWESYELEPQSVPLTSDSFDNQMPPPITRHRLARQSISSLCNETTFDVGAAEISSTPHLWRYTPSKPPPFLEEDAAGASKGRRASLIALPNLASITEVENEADDSRCRSKSESVDSSFEMRAGTERKATGDRRDNLATSTRNQTPCRRNLLLSFISSDAEDVSDDNADCFTLEQARGKTQPSRADWQQCSDFDLTHVTDLTGYDPRLLGLSGLDNVFDCRRRTSWEGCCGDDEDSSLGFCTESSLGDPWNDHVTREAVEGAYSRRTYIERLQSLAKGTVDDVSAGDAATATDKPKFKRCNATSNLRSQGESSNERENSAGDDVVRFESGRGRSRNLHTSNRRDDQIQKFGFSFKYAGNNYPQDSAEAAPESSRTPADYGGRSSLAVGEDTMRNDVSTVDNILLPFDDSAVAHESVSSRRQCTYCPGTSVSHRGKTRTYRETEC